MSFETISEEEVISPEDFIYDVIAHKPPNYGVDVKLTHIKTNITVIRRGQNKEKLLAECAKLLTFILKTGSLPIDSSMTVDYTKCFDEDNLNGV